VIRRSGKKVKKWKRGIGGIGKSIRIDEVFDPDKKTIEERMA
jgi:hypothetical protein